MQAPFTEGYSYQDNLLTEYQYKHGHDVRIVTTTRTRGGNGEYVYTEPCKRVLDNGVELIRISVKSRIRNVFGLYPGMLQQMIEYRPDLIFIHGLCSFVPKDAIRYKRRFDQKVHIVADNHQDEWNTNLREAHTHFVTKLLKFEWKKWIVSFDKIYGTTSWRVRFSHQCYGIPAEKLDLLVLGVDSDRLPRDMKIRKEYRERCHVNDEDFLFVTGGKLSKSKQTIEALEAFEKIDDPKAKFLIFGSLDDDISERFLRICDADSRIIYVGFIRSEEVMNYYAAADFGVFPGRHSVLWEEAIGCGLPCLFHRYEERDHTEVCGNCIPISNADVEKIRSVMIKVFTDKDYYSKMKRNAEKASDSFSYHLIADKSIECCLG